MKDTTQSLESENNEINAIQSKIRKIANAAADDIYTYLSREFSQLIQYGSGVLQKDEELALKNTALQEELNQLLDKYSDLNERYNSLINEHAKYVRNESGTLNFEAVSLGENLQILGQQELEAITKSILEQFPILTEKEQRDNLPGSIVKKKARYTIRDVLVRNVFLKLTMGSNDITKDVCAELEIAEASEEWQRLQPDLQQFIEQCHRLIQDIWRADPPGTVTISRKGASFDASLHEVVPGSEESGIITAVLFPAYKVGDTVLVRSRVRTEPAVITTEPPDNAQGYGEATATSESPSVTQEQGETITVSEPPDNAQGYVEATAFSESPDVTQEQAEATMVPELPDIVQGYVEATAIPELLDEISDLGQQGLESISEQEGQHITAIPKAQKLPIVGHLLRSITKLMRKIWRKKESSSFD